MDGIKLCVFDVDGVLINSKVLHFTSTAKALLDFGYKFNLSEDESFGTIPTIEKLKLLANQGKIKDKDIQTIWNNKAEYSEELFDNNILINFNIKKLFSSLKNQGYYIALASNARYNFLNKVVKKLDIGNVVDLILSAENIQHKPSPTIYLKAMSHFGVSPYETVVIEDSEVGKQAAFYSGAHIYDISSYSELNLNFISYIKTITKPKMPYINKKLNILIPMAGEGSRFPRDIYKVPKPFIDVNGKPMIRTVVENLNCQCNFIFLARKQHLGNSSFRHILENLTENYDIVEVDGLTEGAACTVLLAEKLINNENPLLIVNSDNVIEWDSVSSLSNIINSNIDGSVFCFEELTQHPKWSYAKVSEDGFIDEVAEKNPISIYATTGHYYWKHGKDFVSAAHSMIRKNVRVNNEFYVAPVYNEAILEGKKFTVELVDKMWGLGVPEDLNFYLKNYKK